MTVKDAQKEVISALDRVSDPDDMSKENYLELLQELISDLQMRLEAVESELEPEEDN